MTEQEFWKLIEQTSKKSKGDCEYHQELLTEVLQKLEPAQIIAFDNIFSRFVYGAYENKLWAAAYIINGGCSDDTFMDFRGWLVGQGQQVYEQALADPDSLAGLEIDTDDIEMGYAYCASQAYKEITGEEIPAEAIEELHPENPGGEDWQEEDLETLLPKLSKKYREE